MPLSCSPACARHIRTIPLFLLNARALIFVVRESARASFEVSRILYLSHSKWASRSLFFSLSPFLPPSPSPSLSSSLTGGAIAPLYFTKRYNNFAFDKILIWICIAGCAYRRCTSAWYRRRLITFINSSINSIIRPRLILSIAVLFALAIQQIPIMIVPSNRNYCRNQETWFAEFITELWSGRLVLIIKLNSAVHEHNTRECARAHTRARTFVNNLVQ